MSAITLDQANRIIAAILKRGAEINCRPLSVLVVEPGCILKAFQKEDGSSMGMAMLIPAGYSVAIFVGALGVMIARRLRPGLAESHVMTVAAGGMAGESLMGVIIAALTFAGLL